MTVACAKRMLNYVRMKNPGMPDNLWNRLNGRLWHATNVASLRGIVRDGGIRVSVSERYKNSFCRANSGICLFDFGSSARDEWNQYNNWIEWFGSSDERISIWLEIDRSGVMDRLWDAGEAHQRWKGFISLKIIPGVEACCIGEIDANLIESAIFIDYHDKELYRVLPSFGENLLTDFEQFASELPAPPPEHPLVIALRNKRSTSRSAE
jgi:hypothetical protein